MPSQQTKPGIYISPPQSPHPAIHPLFIALFVVVVVATILGLLVLSDIDKKVTGTCLAVANGDSSAC